MVRNDSDRALDSANERYHGFHADVIKELAAILNFRYELYVIGPEAHETSGSKRGRGKTSTWKKILEELVSGVGYQYRSL